MTQSSITKTESGAIIFDGPEAVNMYAFLAIRSALSFRVKTGMSMMRMQEIKAARNHGWTTAKTAQKALDDLNDIAEQMGLERKE